MITKKAPLIAICRHRLTIDGEGVTTLVAFHGCPLRCKFCLNPQSIRKEEEGVWENYDYFELYEEVKKDELYFLATEGGVTFGGGEPYLQTDFIANFRQACGSKWRLTLETSLNVPLESVEKLLPIIDNYIIDIKDMNSNIYKNYTGKSNQQVIDNLRFLVENNKNEKIIIRVPFISSFNTEEDQKQSVEQLKEMGLSHFDLFEYRTPSNP